MADEQPKLDHIEPMPALEVIQGEATFYVFKMSAKKLLGIAYTSTRTQYNREGIQRGLRSERLADIGKFLTKSATSQRAKPPILPNAIIVSLSADSYFREGKIHICNRPSGEAFVIDGQHRLWAFDPKYSGQTDLDVVVTAFINLADSDKASIFTSINGNQKKIDPSLVYDLIPLLRDTEPVRFEDGRCHDLVTSLNESSNSPWKDRIAMVGAGDRIISQASFISALKKLFKKGHIFATSDPDFFEEKMQHAVLIEYFKAVQNVYSIEWDNKAFFLCKYVGVSAILTLLEMVIADLRQKGTVISNATDLQVNQDSFTPYLERLRPFSFSSSEAKKEGISYVGESGVKELATRILLKCFGESNAEHN